MMKMSHASPAFNAYISEVIAQNIVVRTGLIDKVGGQRAIFLPVCLRMVLR